MAKVTGIGGVFLKSGKDAQKLAQWYRDHLGLKLEDFGGAILLWGEDGGEDGGLTVWATSAAESEWFCAQHLVLHDQLPG